MIRFPQVHIAESVKNRILNVRDELAQPTPDSAASSPESGTVDRTPAVPDTSVQGEAIEEGLSDAPASPQMGEPGSDTAMAVGSILNGGSALRGFINARTQPQ